MSTNDQEPRCAEERAFTWFPKLTRVMGALPPENVAEFALAVAEYGTNAVEPSFSSPILAAVFEGVREDIDNSLTARRRNKGGRPRKGGEAEAPETREKPVSENENQFSENENPMKPVFENENQFSQNENPMKPVSQNENPMKQVSENGNPPYINQTKPYQAKPSQKGRGARMARPTLQEVAAEIEAKGYRVDAEAFMAFYDSNGWKVGKNPMRSWKSALVTWERRDGAAGKGAGDADFSRFG